MKSFFVNIIVKMFGADFIRKHISTLIVTLGGIIGMYFKTHGIDVDSSLLARWLHDTGDILVIVVSYLIGLLIDLKPSTPKVVKE